MNGRMRTYSIRGMVYSVGFDGGGRAFIANASLILALRKFESSVR